MPARPGLDSDVTLSGGPSCTVPEASQQTDKMPAWIAQVQRCGEMRNGRAPQSILKAPELNSDRSKDSLLSAFSPNYDHDLKTGPTPSLAFYDLHSRFFQVWTLCQQIRLSVTRRFVSFCQIPCLLDSHRRLFHPLPKTWQRHSKLTK